MLGTTSRNGALLLVILTSVCSLPQISLGQEKTREYLDSLAPPYYPDKDIQFAYKPSAVYPDEAGGLIGQVYVTAWVDTLGRVDSVEVVGSNHSLFEKYALTLAQQFRFKPVTFKGVKNRVKVGWQITFKPP